MTTLFTSEMFQIKANELLEKHTKDIPGMLKDTMRLDGKSTNSHKGVPVIKVESFFDTTPVCLTNVADVKKVNEENELNKLLHSINSYSIQFCLKGRMITYDWFTGELYADDGRVLYDTTVDLCLKILEKYLRAKSVSLIKKSFELNKARVLNSSRSIISA